MAVPPLSLRAVPPDIPVSVGTPREVLSLPIHPFLSREKVERVVDGLLSFAGDRVSTWLWEARRPEIWLMICVNQSR